MSQSAAKAWIIANCIDDVILVVNIMFYSYIHYFRAKKGIKILSPFFLGRPVVLSVKISNASVCKVNH